MFSIFAIIVCVVFRLTTHFPNLVPVGAMAIFAGRTLPKPLAFLTIILGLLVSDYYLSQLHGYAFLTAGSLFVYAGFAVQVLLGRGLRQVKGGSFLAAIVGAFAFFILSNLGTFLFQNLYPHTIEGLVQCYTMALPFFRATLIGNLVWTAVLSLSYYFSPELFQQRIPASWNRKQKLPLF